MMRYARWRCLAIAVAGLVASVLLSGVATAQQIPPLAEVPPAIAKTHPELTQRRAALAKERDALHVQFNQHNRDCSSVEEGSPQDASCLASERRLSAALDRHIAASQAFNASFRSDIVGPGEVLRDTPNNNQSPSPGKGKPLPPKPPNPIKPAKIKHALPKTVKQCKADFDLAMKGCDTLTGQIKQAECEDDALTRFQTCLP